MIRLANLDDMPELLRMSREFFNVSGYQMITDFDEESQTILLTNLIENEWLLTDGKSGMIGYAIAPLFFNRNCLVGQEMFWWVDPKERKTGLGLELLKGAEQKVKYLGACAMSMVSIDDLNGQKVNKIYQSQGYKPQEQTFIKVL